MGHIKRKRPRRGSLQFWPRKRARRLYPELGQIAGEKPKLLGFYAYKAGMTHIIAVDNRPKAPTKGEEVMVPTTILDAPTVKIAGLRAYSKDDYGAKVVGEVWADSLPNDLSRAISLPKKQVAAEKLKVLEEKPIDSIRAIAFTQPKLAFGKKMPELFEIPIGGSAKEQLEYAKSLLGKELDVSQVFQEGQFLDVHAVTKGKGYQGPIKRFGVHRKHHKSEKGVRRVGTLGNWDAKTWRVAHAGQMGFQTRTDYNKRLLKIGDAKQENVTPDGGFVNYGILKNKYLLLAGSVPGPKKRLVALTPAIRQQKGAVLQAPNITFISRRSQQ